MCHTEIVSMEETAHFFSAARPVHLSISIVVTLFLPIQT